MSSTRSARPLGVRVYGSKPDNHPGHNQATTTPTRDRLRKGDGLGVIVTVHDRDTVELAIAVDEVLTATGTGVGDVWTVGEGDVTVGRDTG